MQQDVAISGVAHAIQLAVAPVFLLSGIGAMLAVLTNRLSRIIDRARFLETQLLTSTPEGAASLHAELRTLARRARHISHAIMWCTVTALLVCGVIATLFIGAFGGFDTSMPVALLFVAGMVALIGGLLFFIREISIATARMRIGPD